MLCSWPFHDSFFEEWWNRNEWYWNDCMKIRQGYGGNWMDLVSNSLEPSSSFDWRMNFHQTHIRCIGWNLVSTCALKSNKKIGMFMYPGSWMTLRRVSFVFTASTQTRSPHRRLSCKNGLKSLRCPAMYQLWIVYHTWKFNPQICYTLLRSCSNSISRSLWDVRSSCS